MAGEPRSSLPAGKPMIFRAKTPRRARGLSDVTMHVARGIVSTSSIGPWPPAWVPQFPDFDGPGPTRPLSGTPCAQTPFSREDPFSKRANPPRGGDAKPRVRPTSLTAGLPKEGVIGTPGNTVVSPQGDHNVFERGIRPFRRARRHHLAPPRPRPRALDQPAASARVPGYDVLAAHRLGHQRRGVCTF